ncbi:MAG: translation initiation factor IF-2 [Verrucomicrobiota bacterium]|nr:translation initiation factor IF-2 [Verrucomicrobiota bacterium]
MPVKEVKGTKTTKKTEAEKPKSPRTTASKPEAASKKTGLTTRRMPSSSHKPKTGEDTPKSDTSAEAQAPKKKPVILDLISSPSERRENEKIQIENDKVIEAESLKIAEATPAGPATESPVVEAPVVDDAESGVDGKYIHIKGPIIVRELAQMMSLKPFQLIGDLMEINVFANINGTITEEQAKTVCTKHHFEFGRDRRAKVAHKEHIIEAEKQKVEDKKIPVPVERAELPHRPPVVTFMGHVDHGKTSLLDCVRKARVAAGEAGGITQHIGAYTITVKNERKEDQYITFLDTPGHEAFSAMRARGANVTDIVVLVVAADDGPMPQTKEAFSHAKAAGVKIIVALNKVDLASANISKVQGQLMELGLVDEELGGDVGVVKVSATKNIGITDLIGRILLESEMLELRSRDEGVATGNVIESQVEQGRGATATVLVKEGLLKVGDTMRIGPHWGKIKALIDYGGKNVKNASPSFAVKVVGLNGVPDAGAKFEIMPEKDARQLAETQADDLRMGKLQNTTRATSMESLMEAIAAGQKKTLNVILKCDAMGSSEAIETQLKKAKSEKITVNLLHNAVGPITETDVILANASEAIIFGFNVKVETRAAEKAKAEKIEIRLHNIIYELMQEVEDALVGKLDPEIREAVIGHAQIKQVFEMSKGGKVAGTVVTDGRISRSGKARILRRKLQIYIGAVNTLRRFQDDVTDVRAGLECGIRLEGYNDYEEGDVIECFILEKVAQKL